MDDMVKMINNVVYMQNKLTQETTEEKKYFKSFKGVFKNDPNKVKMLITALTYCGYFYPGPAPQYERTIVESNPDLCNSIDYYLNMNLSDPLSYLINQFALYQGSMVIYRCWVINNGQWLAKDLILNNKFYSELHQLLNKIESVQNDGKSGQAFWNDEKFSALVDAIELIKQLNPHAVPQVQDYTSVYIQINIVGQVF